MPAPGWVVTTSCERSPISRGRQCARTTKPSSGSPSTDELVCRDDRPDRRGEVAQVAFDGVGGGPVVLPPLAVEVGGTQAEVAQPPQHVAACPVHRPGGEPEAARIHRDATPPAERQHEWDI